MGEHSLDNESNPGASRSGSAISGRGATSVGEALRRAREQRGISLDQIAATTKIPKRHLEALERDDFGVVPGGMYLRAEIRAFADSVGLNRDVALGSLQAATEPVPPPAPVVPAAVVSPDPDKPPVIRASPRPVESRLKGVSYSRTAVAGAIAVLALLVLWAATRGNSGNAPAGVEPQATTAAVEPSAPRAINPSADAPVTQASASSGVAREPVPAASTARNTPAVTPASDANSAAGVTPASSVTATSGVTDAVPTVASQSPAATTERRPSAPQLAIITDPDGAGITVDGVGWGVSPVAIRYLPPGRKLVRVTRAGFATEERVIDLGAGRPQTTVRITLRPLQ